MNIEKQSRIQKRVIVWGYPQKRNTDTFLMSSMEELHATPPPQRFNDASESDPNDDDDDNSSTSTAGPPGSTRTGRYRRFVAESSVMSNKSPNTPPPRGYRRSGAAKRNGSYRVAFSSKQHSRNGRSLSNTSTVASLMGSVQEWSCSFCMFSPGRAAAPPQRSFLFSQRMSLGGGYVPLPNGGAHSSLSVSPRPCIESPRLDGWRHSIPFSPSHGASISGPAGTGDAGGVNASNSHVTGRASPSSASPSPLPGMYWFGLPSMAASGGTPPRSVAYYAMGGSPRLVNRGGSGCFTSAARKELSGLVRSLASHIALTGTPIGNGNTTHPVDIHKGPLIGVGGFAKVYAGVDCVTGSLVAIKEINMAEVNDQEGFRAISKEFGVLKSLKHPNIVSYIFFEHSVSQKVCRIVMELHTGGSTLSLLERFGPLQETILRRFSRHLLEAIAFIHQKGFLHRDIKPANILVSHDGVVKLCDFGCCKRVNELNKSTNCVIGTPLYMAPEFIKGEGTHKSDIWSMGCSLFELATGKLPWYHTGVRDHIPLMFYITTTSESPLVLPPNEEEFDFSPEFIHFLEQCFIRNVSQRPEAVELLKHPWITGRRLHPDSLFTGAGVSVSQNWQSTYGVADEEQLCQNELEEVSARISVEMCNVWIAGGIKGVPATPLRVSQQTELQHKSDDITNTLSAGERRPLELQATMGNSRSESPAASCFSGAGGASTSPTICLDAALHDTFSYTVPRGASAGNFVFPQSTSFSTSLTSPQYLRITDDGNLEFATVADDDQVEVSADIDDAFLNVPRVRTDGKHNFTLDACSKTPVYPGSINGPGANVLSNSPCNTPQVDPASNDNSNVSLTSTVRSSTCRNSRFVPLAHNQSMSLLSSSSFGSRVVSPSRYSQQALNISPTTSQCLQPLTRVTPSSPKPTSPSTAQSSEDVPREGASHLLPSSIRSRLPENVKRDVNGRLCMCFPVPTDDPEKCLRIPLNIDPEDVQCKVIERSPSLVVTFSDNIKAQITAKMNELSATGTTDNVESGLEGHSTVSRVGNSFFRGTVRASPNVRHSLGSTSRPRNLASITKSVVAVSDPHPHNYQGRRSGSSLCASLTYSSSTDGRTPTHSGDV